MTRRCATPGCGTILNRYNEHPDGLCGACEVAERRRYLEAVRRGEEIASGVRETVAEDWVTMKRLMDEGLTTQAIMDRMGLEYPLVKAWVASLRVGRVCEVCGKPQRSSIPVTRFCNEHRSRTQPRQKEWGRPVIVEAMVRFYDREGHLPRQKDWPHTEADHPGNKVVRQRFGSYGAALRAAQRTLDLRRESSAA